VAVPAVVAVAVSIWEMVAPEAAVAPETSDSVTVQENVVPATLLVRAMEGAVPEHIVCNAGVVVATGIGFTVTTTAIGVPVQLLAVGVMV
jgi:hypothetical protein